MPDSGGGQAVIVLNTFFIGQSCGSVVALRALVVGASPAKFHSIAKPKKQKRGYGSQSQSLISLTGLLFILIFCTINIDALLKLVHKYCRGLVPLL